MTIVEESQLVLDDLTDAIDKHNKVIAETIIAAESSLRTATEQLKRAEESLTELKKHLITIVENHNGD